MFDKGSAERELGKLFYPIFLLFLTVGAVSIIFASYHYGLEISKDWKTILILIVIMWLGICLYMKIDFYIPKESEIYIVNFVRSGEPKGFNFEVLMSFLSNLTIAGLALTLSLFFTMYGVWNFLLVYLLWIFAILLIMTSAINFTYQIVNKDHDTKRKVLVFCFATFIAFAIPIVIARVN